MRFASNKGSYEIISAFFFIIVILVAALGLVYYGQIVYTNEVGSIENAQRFSDAKLSKERILTCYGNTQIEYARLEQECTFGPYLNGFTLEVLPTNGCELDAYEKRISNDTSDMLVYYVPVSHPDSGYQCLGKLTVHV